MTYFISHLVFLYVVINVWICGIYFEDKNQFRGGGVLAFSSTHSSVRLPSHIVIDRRITDTNGSIRQDDPKHTAFSSKLYGTATEGNKNNDEQSNIARSFALLLTSQFLLFIGVGAVIPSIPLYGKEIGLSGAANGLVISAPAVALFLAANWSGRRADIARKPAMMIGMAIIAVSDIGTALAQGIYTLVAARLGLGAGRALSEAGERGMLVDLANQIPELRGRALAAQQAAVALGIAIGAPTGGLVVERYGPRAAFLCVSVAAIIALIFYAFLPETIVRIPSTSSSAPTPSDTTKATDSLDSTQILNENTSGGKVWLELLTRNEWKGLTLCQSGAGFGFAAKIASIPILAASTLPGGAVGAGALLSAAGLSGLVGAPVGGYVTDRFGAKNTAIISGIVSGLGLILIPVALMINDDISSFSGVEVNVGGVVLQSKALCFSSAVLLWSLGVSAQSPALTALAQKKSLPGIEATSLSLLKASGDGTYIIAPFILGLIADALMQYPGIECALAGSTTLLGTVALSALVDEDNSE